MYYEKSENIFNNFLADINVNKDKQDSLDTKYNAITNEFNKGLGYIPVNPSYSIKLPNKRWESSSYKVGSFGRGTEVNTSSDLDMIYIIPLVKKSQFSSPKNLLESIRDIVQNKYPNTIVKMNRCVVQAQFKDVNIDIQPVFMKNDDEFEYPDTYSKETDWKITKPFLEQVKANDLKNSTQGNFIDLCKMTRIWKNESNINMSGLLIDTLVANFFDACNSSYQKYDYYVMVRDFFEFISIIPEATHHKALGSNQQVKVRDRYQNKAKKCYENLNEAINTQEWKNIEKELGVIYGRIFCKRIGNLNLSFIGSARNTEEFIEDMYMIDIKYNIHITGIGKRAGYSRNLDLRSFQYPLPSGVKLYFEVQLDKKIKRGEVEIFWKVLNRGDEAIKKDCIRGDIIQSNEIMHKETTMFNGNHLVECYILRNNIVIAKDKIDINIRV